MAAITTSVTFVKSLSAKSSVASRNELTACKKAAPINKKMSVSCNSEDSVQITNRRSALSMLTAGAVTLAAKPSFAAYGEGANVFGSVSNTSGFFPFAGDGYAALIPAKFQPSKEREFPGADARFESNFRVSDNIIFTVNPSSKSKITDYGSPEDFLKNVSFMLGQNSWGGESQSEGGFAENTVSSAALLDTKSVTKKGKTYYELELLTRTADGNEGGRHQLIGATVSNGQLYVIKIQSGDKSWFKGGEKPSRSTLSSFTVA